MTQNPTSPPGSNQSLTIQLLRTREALMAHFRPLLQERHVTEQQWRVLRCLYPDLSPEAAQLAKQAAVLPPSLTRIIRTLEAEGLVETIRRQQDRRRVRIRLTDAGRAFLDEALPESRRIYRVLRAGVGAVKMDYLYDLLAEVAHLCENIDTSPHALPLDVPPSRTDDP